MFFVRSGLYGGAVYDLQPVLSNKEIEEALLGLPNNIC